MWTSKVARLHLNGVRLGLTSVRFQATIPSGASSGVDQALIIPSVDSLTADQASFQADLDTSLVRHLQNRFLVDSITHEELFDLTDPKKNEQLEKFKLYCGADPTAISLHLGNLLPLMVLLHFNLRGHDVVGIVGGATGEVGDPSGRTTERTAIESTEREANVDNIQLQIKTFLERGLEYAQSRKYPVEPAKFGAIETANNATWWKSIKMLDFLANFGRYIRISSMLARDSIQSRLDSQQGLGFNEFTYQILQAYDFWHLFKKENVNMQVGGNDQWGNITAGVDLISRLQRSKTDNTSDVKPAYGLTVPLLTSPSGEKFGKSAGNAVFISTELTSPYQLYQYFINTPDDMVEKLLKVFTLFPIATIEQEIVPKHTSDPGLRLGQRILAREVVDLVHGVGVGEEMAYITGFLFPTPDQSFNDVSADKLINNFRRSGILRSLNVDDLKREGEQDVKMSTVLADIMGKSKSETKKLIKAGGLYLGLDREKFLDPEDVVLFDPKNHLIDGKLLLVRSGKQNYYVVEVRN
ncbi:tyrosine--tRNA ligase, mitochondrial [[Candida] railenensis]|uniref:Tyrosine--tRNA ligase n=1 Tax=[Candida] railenensis TaxID=45579 RepID=A0A9P0QSV7_9ASCO|nr:tyrosine--tRNA ligase, mitochondrial [[Candida] railenensis]